MSTTVGKRNTHKTSCGEQTHMYMYMFIICKEKLVDIQPSNLTILIEPIHDIQIYDNINVYSTTDNFLA